MTVKHYLINLMSVTYGLTPTVPVARNILVFKPTILCNKINILFYPFCPDNTCFFRGGLTGFIRTSEETANSVGSHHGNALALVSFVLFCLVYTGQNRKK